MTIKLTKEETEIKKINPVECLPKVPLTEKIIEDIIKTIQTEREVTKKEINDFIKDNDNVKALHKLIIALGHAPDYIRIFMRHPQTGEVIPNYYAELFGTKDVPGGIVKTIRPDIYDEIVKCLILEKEKGVE